MAGFGNLILKRGLVIPNWSPVTLLEGMPAMQSVGVSVQTNLGTAYDNYPNRFWVGMDTYGRNTSTGGGGIGSTGEFNGPGLYPGNPTDWDSGPKRPLWIGAEIRAAIGVKKNANDSYFTIIKADWKTPSDYILVTQKAIYDYINGLALGTGVTGELADGSVALLNGDKPGTQTFQLPIAVEQKFYVNAYSFGNVNYPATISCGNGTVASIFDTDVLDISLGGASELIEIGDGSTNGNTATTIYGELTVTGPTNLSTDTVIDGGTF